MDLWGQLEIPVGRVDADGGTGPLSAGSVCCLLYTSKGEIKGEKSLAKLAEIFGVQGTDKWDTAKQVAQKVLDDLYKPEYEKMELVEKMAYAPRFKKWQELGILPGGAKSEVFHGVVKCSTNLNSDPVDMYTCLLYTYRCV